MFFPRRRGARLSALRPAPARLRLEPLEGREVPATLLGLTSANTLVTFDTATPGTLIGSPVAVTGLGGESLVGIDYRPANNTLYGVSTASRLYSIDAATGAATAVGGPFATLLNGTAFGVDFNPVPDRLRVVSNTGQSLRINPTTGVAVADTNLTFDPNDEYNQGYYGTNPGDPITPAPQGSGAAYTRNFDSATNTVTTTLYAIDASQDILYRIGGPDGTPSPNGGLSVVVDQIRNAATFAPIDFGPTADFDIEANTDAAFVTAGSTLYSLNITTASATPLGTAPAALLGVAVVPPAAGAGVLQLSASTAAFGTDRHPIGVTVTRTGGASLPVTVNFATTDGTAVAGSDYLPTSGTLSFAAGVTTQTIYLLLPGGTPSPSPAKTFTLTISTPTGGATLGATTATTVTIPPVVAAPSPPVSPPPGVPPVPPSLPLPPAPPPAVSPPTVLPPATHIFAAGGSGGRVSVSNTNGGREIQTFAAFEGLFGGSAVVATGDVNGDGTDDLIVGASAGGGPRVTVYDGAALVAGRLVQLANFFAYEAGFTGGVTLATGDVNGDGFDDVTVGAGAGGGPRVRVLDGASLAKNMVVPIADFFAFESAFTGGVTVASGEFNGDANADVAVGAMSGGGPRVRLFDGRLIATNTAVPVADFFAFEQAFSGGVSLAAGDLNTDGRADLIVGAGGGGGPRVTVYDGRTLAGNGRLQLANFFAYEAAFTGGVNVAAGDVNNDTFDDVITGPMSGGGLRLRALDGRALQGNSQQAVVDRFVFGAGEFGGLYVG